MCTRDHCGKFPKSQLREKMAEKEEVSSTEPCIEYIVVQKMTSDLCNALPIDDLFPSMISNHVIDFKDKAEICTKGTEHSRVGYFLERYLVKRLNVHDTTHFYRFMKVMERSPRCNFLVKRINDCMERCKQSMAKSSEEDVQSTGKGYIL